MRRLAGFMAGATSSIEMALRTSVDPIAPERFIKLASLGGDKRAPLGGADEDLPR